jgi:integrase
MRLFSFGRRSFVGGDQPSISKAMIFEVERRRKRVGGVLKLSRMYYLRYRLGDMPCDRWVSLRVTEKDVAWERARQFKRDYELEAAGLALPKDRIVTASRPFSKVLDDYVSELRTRGRDEKYVAGTEKRISTLARECRWQKITDVSADSFMGWRRVQILKAKTLNDYLTDISSFLGWLVKLERLGSNPLAKVEKIARNEAQEEQRRAFTHDQIGRLRAVSGPRATLYSVALFGGVRRGELSQLLWGDVVLAADGKTLLKLRASTTKNGKSALQPIPDWLAKELSATKPKGSSLADKVFPVLPRMPRFYKDLRAAGIPKVDERGHVAVFHSLRHTLATWLWETGANPREIQELMRHSTLDQTANRYTDKLSLGLRRASDALPIFGAGYTQIGAQISGKQCPPVSKGGEAALPKVKSKPTVNERISRALSWCGEVGQMVRAAGFEPATPSV